MIRLFTLQLTKITPLHSIYRFATIRFPLPDLGEKIKEGRVKKLYVKEGDKIKEFSKIADVESDKQFTEITSPQEGIIKKIYYHEDTVCQVGDIFLEIETNSDTAKTTLNQPLNHSQHPQFKPVQQPSIFEEDYLASATVKMWARQHKIDLKYVKGTGKRNRILKQDIIHFLEARNNGQVKGKIVQQNNPTTKQPMMEVIKVQMNEIEKQMYHLASYSSSIPYLFFHQSIDISNLLQISQSQSLKQKHQKISLLSLLIKTFSLAINQYPRVNSIYDISSPFSFKQSQNQNLLLPHYSSNTFCLIKNLENLSILNIQKTLDTQKTSLTLQNNKQNIKSATITLSNLGEIGGRSIDPLIYGQNVTHTAMGIPYEKVVFLNGKLFKKMLIDISVGADHRVLDGASVAKWTMAWKELSQNPKLAFLSMI